MRALRTLLLVIGLAAGLMASEHLLLVGDDQTAEILSPIRKVAAPVLRKRGIACSDYDKRGLTTADLREDFAKRVLKERPTIVVLAVGASDVWDFRKDAPVADGKLETMCANLTAMVTTLQEAAIKVVVATPQAYGADAAERQAAMVPVATALRQLAADQGCDLLDIHALTAIDGAYKRKGEQLSREGLIAAVEGAIARLGLSAASLPPLKPYDRVVIVHDASSLEQLADERTGLIARFKAAQGADVDCAVTARYSLDTLLKQPDFLKNQRPRALILQLGHSEMLAGAPVAEMSDKLRQVIEQARGHAIEPIMLMTPFPPCERGTITGYQPAGPLGAASEAMAAAVRDLGQELGLPVIDLHAAAVARFASEPELACYRPNSLQADFYRVHKDGIAVAVAVLEPVFGLEPEP